ncbi:microprocessor complex subunit DGCR8-like [Saccoglossus kowalevskii]
MADKESVVVSSTISLSPPLPQPQSSKNAIMADSSGSDGNEQSQSTENWHPKLDENFDLETVSLNPYQTIDSLDNSEHSSLETSIHDLTENIGDINHHHLWAEEQGRSEENSVDDFVSVRSLFTNITDFEENPLTLNMDVVSAEKMNHPGDGIFKGHPQKRKVDSDSKNMLDKDVIVTSVARQNIKTVEQDMSSKSDFPERQWKKQKVDSDFGKTELSQIKISFKTEMEKLGNREVFFHGNHGSAGQGANKLAAENDAGTAKPDENEQEDGELEFDIVDEIEDEPIDRGEDEVIMATDEEDNDSFTEEIDAMLDEGMSFYNKEKRNRKKANFTENYDDSRDSDTPEGLIGITHKTVLKARGRAPLEPLPEGWVVITHGSGMPLYLHRSSRVVTWSRPYFLGIGSARKHKVPVLSIPCMHYKRETEKNDVLATEENAEDATNSSSCTEITQPPLEGSIPQGADETKDEMKSKIEVCKDESVTMEEFGEYVGKLFEFENISIKKFNSWSARRKHNREQRRKRATERPQFPGISNVVSLKLPENGPTHKGKKEITLNLHNKTNVCLLHEYSQRVLKAHPKYIFNENENASAPFQAVIEINNVKYGSGFASNKKLAKEEAAKSTLEILVPELIAQKEEQKSEPNNLEYFDHIAIEDSRVYDLCHKAGQLSPWQILQECLKRNHGMGDTSVKFDVKVSKNQKSEYTMTCGKHVAMGFCKNKIIGKQLASQTILQKLHPQIHCWGSLIRMYGKGVCLLDKEKQQAEQSVMELQQHGKKNRPNLHILAKLQEEMRKMYSEEQDKKKKVKKFHPGNIEKPSTALCTLDV